LEPGFLRFLLGTQVPVEYLYGLSRIELRARKSEEVGRPFGSYLVDEKAILLYSLPIQWVWQPTLSAEARSSLRGFLAEVTDSDKGTLITWHSEIFLGLWFFVTVFAHELGHHYGNQYRSRRSLAMARRHEEWLANLHSKRFFMQMRRRARQGMREKQNARDHA